MKSFLRILVPCLLCIAFMQSSKAATAAELNITADASIEKFISNYPGAMGLLARSEAYLVFPKVYKAGIFFLGGEYGEGVLRSQGKTLDYYSTAAGSFGFQLGAQKKTLIMVFLEEQALEKFRNSENWEVGVDASVAVINVGAGGTIDTTKFNKPIVAFVLDQKGLMYNLTLEGAKFTKINK